MLVTFAGVQRLWSDFENQFSTMSKPTVTRVFGNLTFLWDHMLGEVHIRVQFRKPYLVFRILFLENHKSKLISEVFLDNCRILRKMLSVNVHQNRSNLQCKVARGKDGTKRDDFCAPRTAELYFCTVYAQTFQNAQPHS